MTRHRSKYTQCVLTINVALALGASRPAGWVGGVKFHPDEPLTEIMGALDSTLAQVRVQMEQEIREVCR